MQRKEFLKLAGATVICACVGGMGATGCSSGASNVPPAPRDSYRRRGDYILLSLGAIDGLQAVGGAVSLTLDSSHSEESHKTGILVVHLAEDVYRAYANRCTHRRRELNYLHEEHRLECVSRKAHFDLAGNVIKGPAESALLVYPSHREGDDLVIET